MGPVLALMIIAAAPPIPIVEAYRQARTYDRKAFVYTRPPARRLGLVREVFGALGKGLSAADPPAQVVAQVQAAGFELVRGVDDGGPLWILREPDGQRRGDGFFALRPGGMPVCIQAPHTFFDEQTGDVALALFTTLRASCLFTNTVHRRELDVAHAAQSSFLSATEGLTRARRWPVVQIHGFAESKRVPAGVEAVVSEGTQVPTLAKELAAKMSEKNGRIFLFPRDTSALGATTNVQGDAVRSMSVPFLHIEMSPGLRNRLRGAPAPLAEALRAVLPK